MKLIRITQDKEVILINPDQITTIVYEKENFRGEASTAIRMADGSCHSKLKGDWTHNIAFLSDSEVVELQREKELFMRTDKGKNKFIKIEEGDNIYVIEKKAVLAAAFEKGETLIYLEYNDNLIRISGDHTDKFYK